MQQVSVLLRVKLHAVCVCHCVGIANWRMKVTRVACGIQVYPISSLRSCLDLVHWDFTVTHG